jgi:hypothetical protein
MSGFPEPLRLAGKWCQCNRRTAHTNPRNNHTTKEKNYRHSTGEWLEHDTNALAVKDYGEMEGIFESGERVSK